MESEFQHCKPAVELTKIEIINDIIFKCGLLLIFNDVVF